MCSSDLCYLTIEEQAAWGGLNRFAAWDKDVVAERKRRDMRGKGPGLIAHLVKALLARGANPNAQMKESPARLRLLRKPNVSLINATPFLLAAASKDVNAMRVLAEARSPAAASSSRVSSRSSCWRARSTSSSATSSEPPSPGRG